jgi:hypothetical protein
VVTELIAPRARPTYEMLVSAFGSLVAGTDALRLSVDASSRRLWFTHLLPPGAVQPATVELAAETYVDVDALRSAAVDLIDVSSGRTAALAYAQTSEQTVAVLAVHAGAVDRASLHRLAVRLERSAAAVAEAPHPPALASALEAIEAAGDAVAPDGVERWSDLLARAQRIDEAAFAPGAVSVLRWDRAVTDTAVRDSVHDALRSTGVARLIGDVLDEEASLSAEGDAPSVGPFTVTSPVALDETEATSTTELALLRYHNKTGRRALRRAPSPAVVLTRVYGPDFGSAAPEGTEQLYRAVVRYRIDPEATTITFLGFADGVVAAIQKAMGAVSATA